MSTHRLYGSYKTCFSIGEAYSSSSVYIDVFYISIHQLVRHGLLVSLLVLFAGIGIRVKFSSFTILILYFIKDHKVTREDLTNAVRIYQNEQQSFEDFIRFFLLASCIASYVFLFI